MEVTGYLGPEGSYSNLAAVKLCGGGALKPYASFRALFYALCSGGISAAVLPVENTLNGAVNQNLDLLDETGGAFATASVTLPIDHRLVTVEGAGLKDIKRVYSHPQALEQCSRFLSEKLPQAELCSTSSTAECLKMIKSPACAGIVGSHVKCDGLTLSKECVSDEKNNFTTFLKVVRGSFDPDADKSYIYFSLVCAHRPGELCAMLGILSGYGVNMTKIESRPIKNTPGKFRFFIEIDASQKNVLNALAEIKERALTFKILGAY